MHLFYISETCTALKFVSSTDKIPVISNRKQLSKEIKGSVPDPDQRPAFISSNYIDRNTTITDNLKVKSSPVFLYHWSTLIGLLCNLYTIRILVCQLSGRIVLGEISSYIL
jgi:hypothetical protein